MSKPVAYTLSLTAEELFVLRYWVAYAEYAAEPLKDIYEAHGYDRKYASRDGGYMADLRRVMTKVEQMQPAGPPAPTKDPVTVETVEQQVLEELANLINVGSYDRAELMARCYATLKVAGAT